jgi:hypothetical protein
MGVNHGGTNPPQNLQWGDAYTGCPPDFCGFSKFQALAMDSSPQISTQIYAAGIIGQTRVNKHKSRIALGFANAKSQV